MGITLSLSLAGRKGSPLRAAVNSKPQKACGWRGTGGVKHKRQERTPPLRQRNEWALIPTPWRLPAASPALEGRSPGPFPPYVDGWKESLIWISVGLTHLADTQ